MTTEKPNNRFIVSIVTKNYQQVFQLEAYNSNDNWIMEIVAITLMKIPLYKNKIVDEFEGTFDASSFPNKCFSFTIIKKTV